MRIKAQCGGLLEVGPVNGGRAGKVEFLHQTAKEFVRRQRVLLISLLLYDRNRDDDENGHMYWLKAREYGSANVMYHAELPDVFYHAYYVEAISPHTRTFPLDTILPSWSMSSIIHSEFFGGFEEKETRRICIALSSIKGKPTGLLILAANTGLLRYFQFILETQDIDVSRVTPRPLLHFTCGPRPHVPHEVSNSDRQVAIAELLLQRGALVNAVYKKQTALQYMLNNQSSYESAELCLCLLNHGASTRFVVQHWGRLDKITTVPAIELLASRWGIRKSTGSNGKDEWIITDHVDHPLREPVLERTRNFFARLKGKRKT